MGEDVRLDQPRLEAGREDVELLDRHRQRSGRLADLAVREPGPGEVADRAQREGGVAGQRVGIAEEGADRRDISARRRVGIGLQIGAGRRAGEEDGGARLLRHGVDRVDQRVGAAHQAQYLAIGVDDDDRVLGARLARRRSMRSCARAWRWTRNASSSSARTSAAVSAIGAVRAGARRIAVDAGPR